MKTVTLMSFTRDRCANITSTNLCIGLDGKNQDKCLVISKKRCGFFKKSVLPLAKIMGCYDNIIGDYLKLDKSVCQDIEVRRCECGKEIPKGKQICEKCRKKRRQDTKRIYQQSYRGS